MWISSSPYPTRAQIARSDRDEVSGRAGPRTSGRTTRRSSSCPGWRVRGAAAERGADARARARDPFHAAGEASRSLPSKIRTVFVLIVGCGRVGSSVARTMLREGHEVSCLDEDPESHARLEVDLDKSWEDAGGQFTVGTGLEEDALTAAGIERADAFIASTDGDNTNIVIAQIAKRRFKVPTVIARILDPLRAEWYAEQGVHTVCPTRVAIEMLEKRGPRGGRRRVDQRTR